MVYDHLERKPTAPSPLLVPTGPLANERFGAAWPALAGNGGVFAFEKTEAHATLKRGATKQKHDEGSHRPVEFRTLLLDEGFLQAVSTEFPPSADGDEPCQNRPYSGESCQNQGENKPCSEEFLARASAICGDIYDPT